MRVERKNKKPLIITLIIILTLIITTLVWYYAFADRGDQKSESLKTSRNEKKGEKQDTDQSDKSTNSSDKKTAENSDQSVRHEEEKDLPQLYEGENINNSDGLSGSLTTKSVTGDTLVIRNTINQLISGGTCELTLTSGTKSVKKSAEIIQNPSSSTCMGFDIPTSDLGSGQWNIEIYISSGGKSMTLKDKVDI